MSSGVRVDKWLWAVRLFKTRTAASNACDRGRVRIGGDVSKPARRVNPGDVVTVVGSDRTVVVEVVELLEKRVGARVAVTAYIDHSPPDERRAVFEDGAVFGLRDRGTGRPTKRDRRAIDRLRRREID